MDSSHPSCDDPVIVLTGARSGSTLLRLLLDAHPELACPGETNILRTCSQLVSTWQVVHGEELNTSDKKSMTRAIHGIIEELFDEYLSRYGKTRWCDKSLGSAISAEIFAKLYPKAKFLCLYRHSMDVVYSAIEASPWGLNGYGFDRFANASAVNSVCALVTYWIEHTSQILAFEQRNPDRCLRVQYEQLVTDQENSASQIYSFIGVKDQPGVTDYCFDNVDDMDGPGDHKIASTRAFLTRSIGRGFRVPADRIPPPQLHLMNSLLEKLGYTLVDDDWRRASRPLALCGPRAEKSAFAEQSCAPSARSAEALRAVEHGLSTRLGLARAPHDPSSHGPSSCDIFEIVVYTSDLPRVSLSWLVEIRGNSIAGVTTGPTGPYRVSWTVTADHETWLSVLSGQLSVAVAIRTGALRYISLSGELHDDDTPLDKGTRARDRLGLLSKVLGVHHAGEIATAEEDDL